MRVFVSRYTPGLKPGDGDKVNWEIGESTRVISGQDEGRIFRVMSEGMSHAALPDGKYVREGYFEDDRTHRRCAKAESVLWFTEQSDPSEMITEHQCPEPRPYVYCACHRSSAEADKCPVCSLRPKPIKK